MSKDILKRIYNAFNPSTPANDSQYWDCSQARGGGVFIKDFKRQLTRAEGDICTLFTGHVGSGKSSELKCLHRALAEPLPNGQRLFPMVIDVLQYIDEYDADSTDLLLALITELATCLKETLGIQLESPYIARRLEGLKHLFFAEMGTENTQLSLFGIKTRIRALKQDTAIRDAVRGALGKQPSSLLEAVNQVLDTAKTKLAEHKTSPYDGLVLIVDNLEKVRVVAGKAEGIASQSELFIERAHLLTGLHAHVIYTVPLRLAREYGPQLGGSYGKPPFVLPMIKVRQRHSLKMHQPGFTCMREVIRQRLGDLTLADVFEDDALDFLIKYSGGNPRHLMMFVQGAAIYADALPMTLSEAQRAISQTIEAFSTSVARSHWPQLVALDESETKDIDSKKKDYLDMLDNESILEYINGDGDDVFSSSEPWYVVHPIVRELRMFKAEQKKLANRLSP